MCVCVYFFHFSQSWGGGTVAERSFCVVFECFRGSHEKSQLVPVVAFPLECFLFVQVERAVQPERAGGQQLHRRLHTDEELSQR